jgi:glycosyltransferase involved in cell wall biosynthesis
VIRSSADRAAPLVSIVTATFNRAPYLVRTIESIAAQTYPHIEHIVRDGGSSDGTIELLKGRSSAGRLRWTSQPDNGMYHAINAGLAESNGEILAYLNSDDLYFPWTIATVVEAFRRHPHASFVFGDVLAVDDTTGRQEFYWMPPFNLDFIRRSGFLAQPGVFWRRSAFEDLGPFDEQLRYVADCAYWMAAGEKHRFVKVNEFVAVERNHPGTLRESTSGAVWEELRSVRARYVHLKGVEHQIRTKVHGIRRRFWHRAYWTAIAVQATLPRPVRASPWRNFLNATPDVLVPTILVRTVPFIGGRIAPVVIRPSRRWLEPEAP